MTQLTARIVLAAALGAGMHAVAKDCPQAVVSAAEKAHPGAKIAACREELESGATTFQVKVATPDAKKLEMDIGPDSAILKTEEGMAPGALPDAVARGVASRFPGAKLADVEKQTAPNGDVTYEIECRTGGGRRVVVFDATGGFVREEHDDD